MIRWLLPSRLVALTAGISALLAVIYTLMRRDGGLLSVVFGASTLEIWNTNNLDMAVLMTMLCIPMSYYFSSSLCSTVTYIFTRSRPRVYWAALRMAGLACLVLLSSGVYFLVCGLLTGSLLQPETAKMFLAFFCGQLVFVCVANCLALRFSSVGGVLGTMLFYVIASYAAYWLFTNSYTGNMVYLLPVNPAVYLNLAWWPENLVPLFASYGMTLNINSCVFYSMAFCALLFFIMNRMLYDRDIALHCQSKD